MGERKVINKYLPPDFDPSLIPRSRKPKDGLVSVRMMLPFSIQCTNCSTFMYQGRKFNSKKENVQGPNGKYLGIQRFRFYIKCTSCAQPVSFLTDPKNSDYEMESGATRNYELSKDKRQSEENAAQELKEEEKEDPLKNLENRVLASQREMQEMDNLEEIKAMNMRHVKLLSASGSSFDAKAVLEARERNKVLLDGLGVEEDHPNEYGLSKEDEELVQSTKFQSKTDIIRLDEDDERLWEAKRKQQTLMLEKQQNWKKNQPAKNQKAPLFKIKRRRVEPSGSSNAPNQSDKGNQNKTDGLCTLLGGYGSDSDSE
mmetsp:Transcript_16927/g.25610  ORF Transcript_16927/g.25610 Transcript_16927/m.25610 type:complete len:314 (+) Transcript_16927:115-1056(+)